MFYQRVWAQIDEKGVVQNRMVCEDYETANYLTRCTYGKKALAVEINLWAVTEDCIYKDNVFYKADGTTRCEYLPDVEEKVQSVQSQADATDETVNSILTDMLPSLMEVSK